MKKSFIFQSLVFILLSLFALSSFAWDHSIEFGYGYSHDPNHTKYNNSGYFLSGDIFPLHHSPMTYWSINGALGQWHASTPTNNSLSTAAAAVALRFYPFTTAVHYPSYLLGSAGPAILSVRKFGMNRQGSNLTFQVNVGLGVEVKHFDFNLRFVHFSNAHLAKPDQGFSIIYLFSVGYLF